jgi:hypothetical protein
LAVSYDRTTPVGQLADVFLKGEIRAALCRRGMIEQRMWIYIHFITEQIPNEEMRQQYITNRSVQLNGEMKAAHDRLVKSYVKCLEAMQEIDPIITQVVLDHRKTGEALTFMDLAALIPFDCREKLEKELATINTEAEPFRRVIVENKAFQNGLEICVNGKIAETVQKTVAKKKRSTLNVIAQRVNLPPS